MNAKKKALGKGLGALLDQSGIEAQPTYDVEKDLLPTGTIGKVPVDIIEPNPHQPRSDFDEEALNDLAASIKEQGVIQPITVRKLEDNKLQLISGERRLKAARLAGLSDLPAYIVAADENAMLEMAIVENIQRENLNPIEIALGYKQLINDYALTQERLSERLGKSRSSIANYLRILNLPGEIQLGLRQDLISMGHAKALLPLDDVTTLLEVYQDTLAQNLSVREVEEIVRQIITPDDADQAPKHKTTSLKKQLTEEQKELQESLGNIFNTKVSIKNKKDGKGSIVIAFESQEQLAIIAGKLSEQ